MVAVTVVVMTIETDSANWCLFRPFSIENHSDAIDTAVPTNGYPLNRTLAS